MDQIVCSMCGQNALFKCERCFEPYCGSQCQESDWQNHKSRCYKFPNLLPINILTSVSGNFHLDGIEGAQRRCDSTCSLNERYSSNTLVHSKPKPDILKNEDFNLVPKASLNAVVKPVTGRTTTWRVPFPPAKGFFQAVVQFIEEAESGKRIVWVTDTKYESSLRKLLTEINRTINQKFPCEEEFIYQGALVAAPLDNILYRAEILEVEPDIKKVTVRLIDYGNEIPAHYSQLFAPIPIMCNLNSYAFRVCLPNDYGPVEIENIITIKILEQKQPENYYNVECKLKSISLHLPIELFIKEPLLKFVKCFMNGRNALLRLCSDYGVNDQELERCLNSPQSLSFEFEFESLPKVGAFVAGHTRHGWKRARVLGFYGKQHQFLIYAIDDGFISLTSKIKKLPDNFVAQPIRVFAITTSSADCMLSEEMLSKAKQLTLQLLPASSATMKESKSHLSCSLFEENRKIVDVMTASVFTGLVSELGVKLWHESILEGETVIVSNVLSYKEIYIASQQNIEYPNIFMSEFSKCSPFADDDTIEKNDIVIYIYSKGESAKCCRGQIIKCENGQFKIMDVDSGCEQMVTRRNLRKPTCFVSSLPVRCFRATLMFLEGIPTPVANNKALQALETCMENVVEFNATFNENKAVDLLFRTQEKQSLCKKLLPMVFEPATNTAPLSGLSRKVSVPLSPPNTPVATEAPTVSSSPPEILSAGRVKDKLFTIDDIDVVDLTCGERVPLYVLDTSTIMHTKNPYITAADYNNKDFLAKLEKYLKIVSEYCKSDQAPKNGYAPKKMEICLAVFAEDGEWYRALCVDHKPNDNFFVVFLDYGNMAKVNKKDIMPMTEDLLFPSNANTVYVEGIAGQEQALRFRKSIQQNPVVYANVRRLEEKDAYVAKIHI